MATITLTLPVAGTNITAGLHSNNYSTLQTLLNGNVDTNNVAPAAGIKGSQLATGLNGPPGTEFVYAERTTAATTIQTVVASADILLTLAAFTFDGTTKVRAEVFIPESFNSVAANYNSIYLFEDGAARAILARATSPLTAQGPAVKGEFEFTPAAGAHTYSARVLVVGGTGTFSAGTGTGGAFVPAYLRIVKV